MRLNESVAFSLISLVIKSVTLPFLKQQKHTQLYVLNEYSVVLDCEK